jgi:hypothetical protein
MLPATPIYPMLNNLLLVLDNAFSLLGVAAFAALCLYLMGKFGSFFIFLF